MRPCRRARDFCKTPLQVTRPRVARRNPATDARGFSWATYAAPRKFLCNNCPSTGRRQLRYHNTRVCVRVGVHKLVRFAKYNIVAVIMYRNNNNSNNKVRRELRCHIHNNIVMRKTLARHIGDQRAKIVYCVVDITLLGERRVVYTYIIMHVPIQSQSWQLL